MTFAIFDAVHLLTWAIFVFWEPYQMTKKDTDWYKDNYKKLNSLLQVPPWAFGIIWTILKLLQIAGIFLFSKWSSESLLVGGGTDHWTFVAVYTIFIIHSFIAKGWTLLFFGMRMVTLALVSSGLLCATSILIVIFMGFAQDNVGYLYPIPLCFFIPTAAWLLIAFTLNWNWLTHVDKAYDKLIKSDIETAAAGTRPRRNKHQ
jgi:tryptophan-rich sensory protein